MINVNATISSNRVKPSAFALCPSSAARGPSFVLLCIGRPTPDTCFVKAFFPCLAFILTIHSSISNMVCHPMQYRYSWSTHQRHFLHPRRSSPDHPASSAFPNRPAPSSDRRGFYAKNDSAALKTLSPGHLLRAFQDRAGSQRYPVEPESNPDLKNPYSGQWPSGFLANRAAIQLPSNAGHAFERAAGPHWPESS